MAHENEHALDTLEPAAVFRWENGNPHSSVCININC